jgi:hypothetical protein
LHFFAFFGFFEFLRKFTKKYFKKNYFFVKNIFFRKKIFFVKFSSASCPYKKMFSMPGCAFRENIFKKKIFSVAFGRCYAIFLRGTADSAGASVARAYKARAGPSAPPIGASIGGFGAKKGLAGGLTHIYIREGGFNGRLTGARGSCV